MSGFAALLGPAGKSPDPGLVAALAAAVAPCGPDRQDSWRDARVALVHALLRTTIADAGDAQPLDLGEGAVIVADARVDGRAELIADLRAAGRRVDPDAPHSALILHAWHVWGEECVAHLIGDFAFAIWDHDGQRLFAARDRIGVTPLYYAQIGDDWILADTMAAPLAHPALDRELNRATIGDYLLFGYSVDHASGFYKHVHRLPPAHCLTLRDGELRLRRYWSPPEVVVDDDGTPPDEHVARIRDALAAAVHDRVQSRHAATTLSGGLDSTLIAALATKALPPGVRLPAYSGGFDWLIPDTERYWAAQAAHHLGLDFRSVSNERLLLRPGGPGFRDVHEPRFDLAALPENTLTGIASGDGARVLLMGMGGDILFHGGVFQWYRMIVERRYAALARHAFAFVRHHRRRPPLRAAYRFARSLSGSAFPRGIRSNFSNRYGLESRWRNRWLDQLTLDPRPHAAQDPFWPEMFCAFDPESTRLPLKVVQPMFDVRVIEAAANLPVTPWQFGKFILRAVAEPYLPQSIVGRPKTPLVANQIRELERWGGLEWLKMTLSGSQLEEFVDSETFLSAMIDCERFDERIYGEMTLAVSLGHWLRSRQG